ncbi:hypothetical protein [Spartinivicinus marinus]|nr:hypothetical protein [Spartinivicinus marinus]MCX4027877.1 hypothetical protein [Spartinivicinus marinus]
MLAKFFDGNAKQLIEKYKSEGKEPPWYAYPALEKRWEGLPIAEILDCEIDFIRLKPGSKVIGREELIKFVTEWNQQQKIIYYAKDRTKIVIIDQARFDQWIAEE